MMGFGLNKNVSEKYIKKALPLTLVCIAGLLMEIMFTTYFRLHNNVVLCLFTYPAIFFLLVWALNHPHPGLYRIAKYCAGMASVMYLGHCVITNYMQSFHVSETATFMTGVLITALVGFVLTRTDHPFVNKLF